MIQVKEIVNSIFTSKTYILYREGEEWVWLVDIGDVDPVESFLEAHSLTVKGVLLTHGHFDHIYGLPRLVERFPKCSVFSTEFTKRALASDKLNMSRYHETPMSYEGDNVLVVHEGEVLLLFESEPLMRLYETPGHNPGCLTMVIGDYIFTGDAYIPGVGANTQLPYADKKLAGQSMERILKLSANKVILSGHYVEQSA